MHMPDYVTCEQCEEHRTGICEAIKEQEIKVAKVETKMDIFEKLMYSILGVLIAGFAGTIFAVLRVGGML